MAWIDEQWFWRLGAALLTGDRRIANAGVARCPIEAVALGR